VRESLVSWLRRRPVSEATGAALSIRSGTLARMGQCAEANAIADSLYAADRTVASVSNRGIVAAHCGRQTVADSMSRSLDGMEEPFSRGNHLLQQARIAAIQGKKAQAVDLLVDAFARGVPLGNAHHSIAEFAALRGFAPYESAVRPKQ
jgi:hypothetical protein